MRAAHAVVVAAAVAWGGVALAEAPGKTGEQTPAESQAGQVVAKENSVKDDRDSEAGKHGEHATGDSTTSGKAGDKGEKSSEGGKDAGKQEDAKKPEQSGDKDDKASEASNHGIDAHVEAADPSVRCLKPNAMYHPLDMIGHVMSVEVNMDACRERCARIDECRHFTFNHMERNCHVTDGSYLVENAPGFVAGPRQCEKTDVVEEHDKACFIEGAAYTPLDMIGAVVTFERNARQCQARCAGRSGCLHFTFTKIDGSCHISDGHVLTRGIAGSTAGHPTCNPPCFHEDAAYFPLNMQGEPQSVVANLGACQERCAKRSGCKHFNFVPATRECHITDGHDLKLDQHGYTAGPSICEFPNTDNVVARRFAGTPSLFGVPSPNASFAPAALAALLAAAVVAVAAAAGLRARTQTRGTVGDATSPYARCPLQRDVAVPVAEAQRCLVQCDEAVPVAET